MYVSSIYDILSQLKTAHTKSGEEVADMPRNVYGKKPRSKGGTYFLPPTRDGIIRSNGTVTVQDFLEAAAKLPNKFNPHILRGNPPAVRVKKELENGARTLLGTYLGDPRQEGRRSRKIKKKPR